MTTAIIQGASGGIGLPLTRYLLAHTGLNVIALTSKTGSSAAKDLKTKIAESGGSSIEDRLEVISDVDCTREDALQRAVEQSRAFLDTRSKSIGSGARSGVDPMKDIRLLVSLTGTLHPEKSLAQIDAAQALKTFELNTLSHLLFYKHFVPLVPTQKEFTKLQESWKGGDNGGDPARGYVRGSQGDGGTLCLSLSARVGSIADNQRGGWYSYRASKAALNQIIRSLDHELVMKKSCALAMGYHPGTVLTSFTRPILGSSAKPDESKGKLTPERAVEKLMGVIKAARRGDGEAGYGGGFYDWKNERVPW